MSACCLFDKVFATLREEDKGLLLITAAAAVSDTTSELRSIKRILREK